MGRLRAAPSRNWQARQAAVTGQPRPAITPPGTHYGTFWRPLQWIRSRQLIPPPLPVEGTLSETQADNTLAAYGVVPITTSVESFNKADGALGPDLSWTRVIFTGPNEWAVVGNEARFAATVEGSVEDLQIPGPGLGGPDVEISMDVTELIHTGANSYWVGGGIQARYLGIDINDYRAYAIEIGRNNQIVPGVDIWFLAIWRINTTLTPPDDAVIIASAATSVISSVVLPGRLTFRVVGTHLLAAFTHAGTGPTLVASVTDATYADGLVGLGGGHSLTGGDSGSVDIDNFTVRLLGYVSHLAEAQAGNTLVATGQLGSSGSLSEAQADNTLSASGQLGYSGSLAETQDPNTLSAIGTITDPPIEGSLAETQANNTLAASGNAGVQGAFARVQADNTLAVSGTFTAPPVIGTLAETQDPNTLVASGFIGEFETAAERIIEIVADPRTLLIAELRATIIEADLRTLRIAEDRTQSVEAEDRTLVAR